METETPRDPAGEVGTKTVRPAALLRWVRDRSCFVADILGPRQKKLQQAWECLETGEVEWRDVPLVEE